LDNSMLKSLMHSVKTAISERDLIRAFLEGMCEIMGSTASAVWFNDGEDQAFFFNDGVVKSLRDFGSDEAHRLWLYLKSIESPSDAPAVRDGSNPLCFPGWSCLDRGALAPFRGRDLSGWLGVFGRDDNYTSSDLMAMWLLGDVFSLSMEVLKGRSRLGEIEQWGHYLRTPLWTMSLALEDLKESYSPQSASLAFGAARVLASQIDTFLCEIELESQRFGSMIPLSEALESLGSLGQGWNRMEGREFELEVQGDDPGRYLIKYGALQALMGALNMYYVDRMARKVSVGLAIEEGSAMVMVEAWSLSQGATDSLRRVVEYLAERYLEGVKFFSSVGAEGVEMSIKVQPVRSPGISTLDRPPKVLVVDDSLVSRKSLSMMLEKMGVQVFSAADGLEALEVAMREDPDLVFMDLLMPRMGGVEAASKLREMGFGKPILALTAGGESDLVGALEAGMDETLFKPISANLLMDVISQWTGWNPEGRGDDQITARAREDFLEEVDQLASLLVGAIDRGDLEEAAKLAHRIKGDSALGGFMELSQMMGQLEGDIRTGADLSRHRDYLASDLRSRLMTR